MKGIWSLVYTSVSDMNNNIIMNFSHFYLDCSSYYDYIWNQGTLNILLSTYSTVCTLDVCVLVMVFYVL